MRPQPAGQPKPAQQPRPRPADRKLPLHLVRSQPLEQAAVVDLTMSKDASDAANHTPQEAPQRPCTTQAAGGGNGSPDRPGPERQPPAAQARPAPAARERVQQGSEQQDIRHLLRPLMPSPGPGSQPLGPVDLNGQLSQERKRTLDGQPKAKGPPCHEKLVRCCAACSHAGPRRATGAQSACIDCDA